MNMHQHITIHVNVPRPQTEAERFLEQSQGWERMLRSIMENKIAHEQQNGNPIFDNIETHAQYVAALDADEKHKRQELGFWKYYFGS